MAGAVAVAASAVLVPPPASAQAQGRPPAPDRVSAASRPARDGPITPAGMTGPAAANPAPAAANPGPAAANPAPAPGVTVVTDPCRTRAGPARPIALNSASRAELEELPGIGPAKAQLILDWRGKHGRFRRIVDLRRVKGFGRKTVMRLAPYLVLDASPVTTSSSRPTNGPPPAGSK